MKKMTIGVSLGYNTSAAVVSESGVEYAISEERLIGEKNTKMFPINSIRACVDYIRQTKGQEYLKNTTLDIGISSYEVINGRTMKYMPSDASAIRKQCESFDDFLKMYIRVKCLIHWNTTIDLKRFDHHTCHSNPAGLMSGYFLDSAPFITVTYDGFGDGECATIKNQKTNQVLAKEYIHNSLGLVYQFVTGALGFKEHQHEGKITGLAAFGEPKYVDAFKDYIIDYSPKTMSFIPYYKTNLIHHYENDVTKDIPYNKNIYGFDALLELKASVYDLVRKLKEEAEATREDIAASVQEYTEQLVVEWINDVLDHNKIYGQNIALAGGLFANVKVNYRVKMETESKSLYVLPPMGDEGTAIGAAIEMFFWVNGRHASEQMLRAWAQDNLYLGRGRGTQTLTENHIDFAAYDYIQLNEMRSDDYIDLVSKLLAENRIVCISRGYSEFGPRALGNHSILYDAGEKETNDSLNEKLGRTEFMPFAPITIEEYAEDLFENISGLEKSLQYMTVAVPVKEEFIENYKAAYHIDNTARPQILCQRQNGLLHGIIMGYHMKTGKKALINTSFNLHNSPIIFDDLVAYESFVKADLDALVLDNIMLVKKGMI